MPAARPNTFPAIECPNCGYSLRGLDGAFVQCPECGSLCDVALIISRRLEPGSANPEYRRFTPPAIAMCVGLVVFVLASWIIASVGAPAWLSLVVLAIVAAAWAYRVAIATVQNDDRQALWLIALMHVVYGGFLVFVLGGLAMFLYQMIRLTDAIADGRMHAVVQPALYGLLAGAVGLISVPLLRKLDRYVAQQCIRRSILRESMEY